MMLEKVLMPHKLFLESECSACAHITGIVQGVGFRPFVYNLAARFDLKGWVRNTSAGVDIEVDREQEILDAFIKALRDEAPQRSRIDELTTSMAWQRSFVLRSIE